MKNHSEALHKELLELISTLSDGTISDRSSLACTVNPRTLHELLEIRLSRRKIELLE
jgi:hypothetical protein